MPKQKLRTSEMNIKNVHKCLTSWEIILEQTFLK